MCRSIRPTTPTTYETRNHAIVDACRLLIATPRATERAQPRSGTWATIRYAQRKERPVWLIWPDGTVAR